MRSANVSWLILEEEAMSTLGAYCKAYPISRLRRYQYWKEPDTREFGDEAILFLHDNYVVTDNIYLDEGIVFNDITSQWKLFCDEALGFQEPAFGDL